MVRRISCPRQPAPTKKGECGIDTPYLLQKGRQIADEELKRAVRRREVQEIVRMLKRARRT